MVMASKNRQSKTLRKRRIINVLLLSACGVLLFLAQSGVWLHRTIFNQQAFTAITTDVLLTQDSRDSIARVIVDEALEGRAPAVRFLGDRAVGLVSSLLGSDISREAFTRLASSGYAYLTSDDRQDIAINLAGIKSPVSGIISFAESQGRSVDFDPSLIPDQIVLARSDELPKIASYIRLSSMFSFLAWLFLIVLLLVYLFINRLKLVKSLYAAGAMVIVTSLVTLFVVPFIPSVVSGVVDNIQFRGMASDLASAYLRPLVNQMYLTIAVVVIALAAVRFRSTITKGSRLIRWPKRR